MDIGAVTIAGCRCRCGHEWLPRDRRQKPRVCPRCKSPNWDKPKREPGKSKRRDQGIFDLQSDPISEDDARTAYRTRLGQVLVDTAEGVLDSDFGTRLQGRVHLIFTSPPFPLNRKKKYGNLQGERYIQWLVSFAGRFRDLLTPDGSIVVELGNAWEPGRPVMSTLALRALIAFLEAGRLNLCQQVIVHNPARLPSPAQWVNIERIRVKDAYTNVWWMAPTDRPKADNRRVLRDYSPAMLELLATGEYNSGKRPSEHNIGAESFLTDNQGAIPPNVLTIANTSASDPYRKYCREKKLPIHPARMAPALAEWFIRFLTEPEDLVLDPFAGCNTTGAVAESLGRRWLAIEPEKDYVEGSLGWFPSDALLTNMPGHPAVASNR